MEKQLESDLTAFCDKGSCLLCYKHSSVVVFQFFKYNMPSKTLNIKNTIKRYVVDGYEKIQGIQKAIYKIREPQYK